jgi:hypothetical protein
VVVRCKNVVSSWLVRNARVNPFDEEEDGDKKKESGGVMVCWVGQEEEKSDCENGGEDGERFPCANFGDADHRWIECIAQMGVLDECR